MDESVFFVSGITGHVGGAAARYLLKEGRAVRALVRDPNKAADWASKGVDVRQGDFNDAASVASALEGVAGAFLMIPPVLVPAPDYAEARAVIASFREALRHSPPPRLVLLSSVGSEQSSGLGNITTTHLMEEALGDLPFPTAIVRAGSFLENYTHSLFRAAETGVFDSFFAPVEHLFPMTATGDIGNEIARLLIDGWDGKKIVELGSLLSPNDLARAMGEVLGRPVEAKALPRDSWAHVMEAMGLPPGRTNLYEEMMDGFNAGWINFGVPGAERVEGTVTPAEVFAQAQNV